MKNPLRLLSGFIFLVLSLPLFCETPPDAWGQRLNLSKPPQAVVSVTAMTDEYLTGLVPLARIKALSSLADDSVFSNVEPWAKLVPNRARLSAEMLLKLKPDLILVADWSDKDICSFLQNHGIPVWAVKTPRTWVEVKNQITQLGQVLQVPDQARDWIKKLEAQEQELKKYQNKSIPSILEYSTLGSSMANGTLWNDVLPMAGARNAVAGLSTDAYGYTPLSTEMLLKINPDWLVLPRDDALKSYGQINWLNQLKADPVWKKLKAVQTNHILFLRENEKTAVSPSVLQAVWEVARGVHPQL